MKLKLNYEGSRGWLIFWVLVFLPVALVLLATGSYFESETHRYSVKYDGSRFWFCFWVLVFFPVAIVLLFIDGFSVLATPKSP